MNASLPPRIPEQARSGAIGLTLAVSAAILQLPGWVLGGVAIQDIDDLDFAFHMTLTGLFLGTGLAVNVISLFASAIGSAQKARRRELALLGLACSMGLLVFGTVAVLVGLVIVFG